MSSLRSALSSTTLYPITIGLIFSSMLISCATMRESLLAGTAIGAGAGGLIGHGASPHDGWRPALMGAGIGALSGAFISYLVHRDRDKKSGAVAATKTGSTIDPNTKPSVPLLTRPEVRSIWVPDKIDASGARWEQGHHVFVIEKQSSFSE